MEYDYDLDKRVCTNCGFGDTTEKIGIPFTKKQLGQGLWFGLLLTTFIWGIIDWNGIGTGVFIAVWCLGQLVFAMHISLSFNRVGYTYLEVMPWYYPFYWLVRLFSGGGRNKAGGVAKKFKWKEAKEE